MANKRDSSRQKRARENRAQRAALAARTTGAPPVRPSRVAPATADRLKKTAETKGTSSGSGRGTGSADDAKGRKKPRRERPPRPGDRPVDLATLEGSWISKIMKVPGGTQVLFAGVMAIVATGLMTFTKVFVAAADVDDKDAKATQTVFEAKTLPVALALVVLPLAITAFAIVSSLRPYRRRVWLGAAIVLGALSLALLQLYLIVAGFLAYALFRAAKVEGPSEPLVRSLFAGRRGRRSADETGAERSAPAPADDI